ncbi:MAG: tRNA pseudouridine(38-40) synthase TruA [Lentihominibacter sp.]
MDRNVLLTIAYDGSVFHGWQRQPAQRTVQGHLERVMSEVFRRQIMLSGTSRTDAGVHALGQRASFRAPSGIPTEKIPLVVNNALAGAEKAGGYAKPPVRILKAEDVADDFHARFNCKGKTYIYRITAGTGDDSHSKLSMVFDRNYTYHLPERLDVEAMNEAAAYLVGTRDFKSFEASGGNPRETTVRTITRGEVRLEETTFGMKTGGEGDGIQPVEFIVTGDGFLYNMVRIITGTLVEVGRGKRKPEDMRSIILAESRSAAGHTAPPGGLYLAEIYY